MEDDDIDAVFDEIPARAQAVRDIASDLETAKNRDARRHLNRCADLILQQMEPPKARIVGVITNAAKSAKEQPL